MKSIDPSEFKQASGEQPFDVSAFQNDNRIHVQYGSQFTDDHFVVVHPKELLPENEQRFAAKLLKHYSIYHPHFMAPPARMHVALSLAEELPVSVESKQLSLMKQWQELYLQEKTGQDQDIVKQQARHAKPFDALIKNYTDVPEIDPVGAEALKQATALYLMVNEALHAKGFSDEAALYVPMSTADAMLVKLGDMLGFDAKQFNDVTHSQGLEGIANLLQLDAKTVNDIRDIVDYAADHNFSNNVLTNWMVGYHSDVGADKPAEDIMVNGLMMRVANKIHDLRQQHQGVVALPEKAQRDTEHMVAALRHLPSELAELLYINGTEFAYTDAPTVQAIDGRAPGAAAFHHAIPFEPASPYGVRQVFVAARNNQAEFDSVVAHEAHHVLYPLQFSEQERVEVDTLITKNAQRLNGDRGLQPLMQAWNEADTESQKQAVIAELEGRYLPKDQRLQSVLGNDYSVESFMRDVDDAARNLDPNSPMLTKYYADPESRAAELISRFSELKYVRMKDHPEVLQFIAPEMNAVYDGYFMPHVRDQLAQLKAEQTQLPDYLQNMGYPANNPLPTTQVDMPEQSAQSVAPTHLLSATSIHHEAAMPVGRPEAMEAIHRLEGKHGHFVAQLDAQVNQGAQTDVVR